MWFDAATDQPPSPSVFPLLATPLSATPHCICTAAGQQLCLSRADTLPITVPVRWGQVTLDTLAEGGGQGKEQEEEHCKGRGGNCLYDFHFITRKRIEMNFYCATTKRADNISTSCCCCCWLVLLFVVVVVTVVVACCWPAALIFCLM